MVKEYEIQAKVTMDFVGYFEADSLEDAKEKAEPNIVMRGEGAGFSFPEIKEIDGEECKFQTIKKWQEY